MLDGGRSLDRHAWLHLVQGDGGEAAARVLFGAGVVKLRALLMHSDDDINSQHCGCWLYGLTIRCKDLWWLRRCFTSAVLEHESMIRLSECSFQGGRGRQAKRSQRIQMFMCGESSMRGGGDFQCTLAV